MPSVEGNSNAYQPIGQVVEMLASEYPDVTHSSLRFLEREGLIEPSRTAGGHRIFSPDQIERIRLIKKWQSQRLSLDEIKQRFQTMEQLPKLDIVASRILQDLIEGNRESAQQQVLSIYEAGLPLEAIFDEVVRPILLETGERWAREELPVGQEKEISSFMRDVIATLGPRDVPGPEDAGPVIIAACVEGETHELGLRMVTALLRAHGYIVYYLGPSVSPDFLIERVKARQPDAVLLSIVRSSWLNNLERTIDAVRSDPAIPHQPMIIVGGEGIAEDWSYEDEQLEKVVTQARMSDAIEKLNNIIRQGLEVRPGNSTA